MISIESIKHFPAASGVYLMKDETGRIIYVGKALNLKKRVSSYFNSSGDSRYQIRFLMARVETIEWLVTDTEKEALILENSLIKEYRPRYNLSLRDDKTYFSLRLDPSEEFPRLTIIRKVVRDGAKYFGPYSSATAAREVLKELCRLFPLRHYPLKSCRQRKRPCLYYQLRQCSAPCFGKITPPEYAALVEGASLFLSGRNREVVRFYKERMAAAAGRFDYEEAGRCRDMIFSIERTVEKQKVASTGGDADVIGLVPLGERLQISLLFIRNGLLLGSRSYRPDWALVPEDGLASFISGYYMGDVIIPDEILLPLKITGAEAIAELLSEKKGRKVAISTPQRGAKLELVQMAVKNAENSVAEQQRQDQASGSILAELKERLHLENLPRRIECYDISNISGKNAVGSKVSFLDGKPDKSAYRRFRINSVGQSDDFAMMREILSRRFSHEKGTPDKPDLIIVDGGIGQLGILSALMDELGISGIDLAGLAKSRVASDVGNSTVERSDERVFLPGRKNPVVLRQNSPQLLLLAQIRDEAHRFAITYHRKLRSEAALVSRLDSIKGVGAAIKKRLLEKFGTVEGIKGQSTEELCAVKGVTEELASRITRELAD
ncbi:MAG: excinuclease ABC subunit UvrC [Geobacteraceae bacterium]|nr:excinuclease ABC subunit UvrC [Geobacteraceae bacterium]